MHSSALLSVDWRRSVGDCDDSGTSCAAFSCCCCRACAASAGCRRSRDESTAGSMMTSEFDCHRSQGQAPASAPAQVISDSKRSLTTMVGTELAKRAGCSSAGADQLLLPPRNNLNYYNNPTRRRKQQKGRRSARATVPPLLLLAVLLSSLACLPSTSAAAQVEAQPAAATKAAATTSLQSPSRKRPRRQRRRRTGAMVTGDISQIISLRIHPHPEPTAEPTFEPTAEPTVVVEGDDDALYDGGTYGGMPQPRNERPWEELQNNTDTAGDMEGRDAEDEGEDEDGDSDDEDPASDNGGSLLNLLDQVDNGEATKTTTNNNDGDDDDADADTKGTDGGGMEIIDVSPGEYAVPLTPAPAAMPVVPPSTDSPTAAPVTASPTRKPTLAPTRQPTIAPTTAKPTPVPSPRPTTAAPTTAAPTRQPQTAPTTDYPTALPTERPTLPPTTGSPTLRPSTAQPTIPPVLEPTATPTSQPTPRPTGSPTPAPTLPIQEFLVELEFVFDDMPKLEDSSIILWEEVTADQVFDHMYWTSSEIGMEEFLGMGVNTRIRRQIQGVPDINGPNRQPSSSNNGVGNDLAATDRANSDKGGRRLQAAGLGGDGTPTPLTIIAVNVIKFRSTRVYTQERIEDTVGKAFNSESDREKYIQELRATNDRSFRNVNSVVVIMNGSPVPEAPTPAPVAGPGDNSGNSGGGINIWLIVGPLIGGVLVIVAFGILIYSKRQNKRKKAFMSKAYDATRVSKFVDVNQSDDVSTLGDPFPMFAASPLVKDTADNSVSVMSADYDYARAFGTRGDAPTASTPKSFEADRSQGSGSGRATLSTATGGFAAKMDATLFQDDVSFEQQYCEQEERIEVDAPAGKLGVVIDTPVGGVPLVHAIKDTSVLADKVRVGDQLVSVDDIDTTQLSAIEVSKLISSRANNPSRVLVFIRLRVGD